jgi:NAD(P)H-nitrite reductase large subunit
MNLSDAQKELIKLKNIQVARIDKMQHQLATEQALLKDMEKAITNIKQNKPVKKKKLEISKEYNHDMKWESKVIYVVNKLKEPTLNEITDKLANLDNASPEKIYLLVQQVIIRMIKANKLIKIGDYASKYKLNPEYNK